MLPAAAILAILIVAATIRVALADYSLWFDEYASLFFSSQPLSRLWSMWMVRETNPPLFYTLLKLWIDAFGSGQVFILRLLPIAANLGFVLVAFLLIRRHYGDRAALLAAAILAVSAQQVYFSHQVRAYSFLSLGFALSLTGLASILSAAEERRSLPLGGWILYASGAAIGVYLHTTAIFWPAIASLSVLIVSPHMRRPFSRNFAELAVANAAILLASSWWLFITYHQVRQANHNIDWIPQFGPAKAVKMMLANGLFRESGPLQSIGRYALLALAAFGAYRTRASAVTKLLVSAWAIGILVYLLLSTRQPIVTDRTVFWMTLFPIALAAVGIASLSWRYSAALAACTLLLMAMDLATTKFQGQDWQGAVFALAADPRSVLVAPDEGFTVAMQQACGQSLRRSCPFPMASLGYHDRNSWAQGYGTRIDEGLKHRILSGARNIYLIGVPADAWIRPLLGPSEPNRRMAPKHLLEGPFDGSAPASISRESRVMDGELAPLR